MSKSAYRIFDLVVLTLITTLADGIDAYVFHAFGSQVYVLSVAAVMGMIAIYRWNAWGLVVPVVAGGGSLLVNRLVGNETSVGLTLTYTVGYLSLAVCLLWFIKKDKSTLNSDKLFKFGYFFSGFLTLELARALCQIGNGNFWSIAIQYYAWDLLNVAFGLMLYLIACKQPNFVVDMNDYLIRLHSTPSSVSASEEARSSGKSDDIVEHLSDMSDAAALDGGMLDEDDLRKLDEPLNKRKNKDSVFDKENQAIRDYHEKKKGKK